MFNYTEMRVKEDMTMLAAYDVIEDVSNDLMGYSDTIFAIGDWDAEIEPEQLNPIACGLSYAAQALKEVNSGVIGKSAGGGKRQAQGKGESPESETEREERLYQLGYELNRAMTALKAVDATLLSVIMKLGYDDPVGKGDLDALFGVHHVIEDIAGRMESAHEKHA